MAARGAAELVARRAVDIELRARAELEWPARVVGGSARGQRGKIGRCAGEIARLRERCDDIGGAASEGEIAVELSGVERERETAGGGRVGRMRK
jgi:hypothetical protein